MNNHLTQICDHFNLGKLIDVPIRVHGGFSLFLNSQLFEQQVDRSNTNLIADFLNSDVYSVNSPDMLFLPSSLSRI